MEEELCHASGNQDSHHGFAVDKSALSTKQYFRGMFLHLPESMQQQIKTILKAEVQPRSGSNVCLIKFQVIHLSLSGEGYSLSTAPV